MSCTFIPCLPHAHSLRRAQTRSVVVLGGSSGVGLEVAQYLRSRSSPVSVFSRSSGHDFRQKHHAQAVFSMPDDKFVVCVGGGRRKCSFQEEQNLYRNITSAAKEAGRKSLVAFVLRSMIIHDVRDMLSSLTESPWVLIRPGALVDFNHSEQHSNPVMVNEKLLVTPDIRCNGLVSRRGVARLVGDLMLDAVSIDVISGKVIGVYDRDRMINNPSDAPIIGEDIWN